MENKTLPQSSIDILTILKSSSGLTNKAIIEQSGFAPRTVRYSLRRLKDSGLIIEKFNFHDARQRVFYYVCEPKSVVTV